jgi:predicted negative regulator of RcsB-dependent stress response
MGTYDLQEQEQIDDLKAWWQRYGNAITWIVVAACVGIAAVQGWRWWTAKQNEEASVLYTALSQAVRAQDLPKAKEAALQLTGKFAGTGYSPRGALVLAKLLYDSGDAAGAKAQLQWVIDKASETDLKEIARYRLAEVLVNDKQYDEALKLLDAKHGAPYAGLYADLRGDALALAGRTADARAAYADALAKLDPKSSYKQYVQVKLDALGGAPAPAVPAAPAMSGGGTGSSPAATK